MADEKGLADMKEEMIMSAGIDIGTSTTQLIFSKMLIRNVSGFGKIPQAEIISKEIVYKSDIYVTPLLSEDAIDGEKVRHIIVSEYEKAGIRPEDLTTGAIIITGESSRKKNAREVVESLAQMAGDFVVAEAGPELEAVLAGKGAGAGLLSKQAGKVVANLDIGGGTTNICYFEEGEILDTACLDIGGRLIRIQDGKVIYISSRLRKLLNYSGIELMVGETADKNKLSHITDVMAEILVEAIGWKRKSIRPELTKTNHLITVSKIPDRITLSGGVAICIDENKEDFQYGDIGVLLAKSIKSRVEFSGTKVEKALETMRATVIGAGNFSMRISGSTIEYTIQDFPLKNIPVAKWKLEKTEDIEQMEENMAKAAFLFDHEEHSGQQIAFAMKGLGCPSFVQVQCIAERFSRQFDTMFQDDRKMILMIEQDIGKALGQALKRINRKNRDIVCIDGIRCDSGDYIDLGKPIVNGTVIPVIVKTLIFNQ